MSRINPSLMIETLLYLFPLAVSVVLFITAVAGKLEYQQKKMRYSTLKAETGFLKTLSDRMCKYGPLKRILNFLAVRLSMYNQYTLSKNIEIAGLVFIVSITMILLFLIIFLPSDRFLWYMALAYLTLTAGLLVLIFYVFALAAKIRFTNKLPETFKMLNSRYMSKGNIQEAIWLSLDDMDKIVRREMKKVYDSLNTNNMSEIDNTFDVIDRFYKNEYLTLLLNLIKQAHYKGGNAVIKEQFENTTEEILSDIDKNKDLAVTSRSYIVLSLLMPAGILGIELFNKAALGTAAEQFYKSPFSIGIKIVFFASLALYIGYLLYLERVN